MNLKECYEAMGGAYDDVVARMRGERLVYKFVRKFLDDPSFSALCEAIDENNCETAFRAAHTIKGICQNLGFSRLLISSSALTEALRGGSIPDNVGELFMKVSEDYEQVCTAIGALDNLTEV